ncbi:MULTISPECIES: glyoxalase superfamily protein [unclassified Roseitalea]|uniref:VOC family protein n=1 Tax=unclassified Roseitalea TaxID=2639107 RepID=UPI00273DDD53|nr:MULTISPECIES: glyoxalase superfamily protein [unclassified Roseitalea]
MLSHIHFQSIGVVDMYRAVEFYRDMLGMRVERDAPYGDSRWIFMQIPGARTMLHFDQHSTIEPQDKPALVLATDDVDALCEDLTSKGVAIQSGPDDAPWEPGVRWAMIHDSEGNLVLLQTVAGQ